MDENNVAKLDASNKSGEYKVEEIQDSTIYARESESGQLPRLYYLVSWKGYSEEKISSESTSVVQHLRNLIYLFHKDHLNKSTTTSPAMDILLLIVKLAVKPTDLPKWKQGRRAKRNTAKRVKWGDKEDI